MVIAERVDLVLCLGGLISIHLGKRIRLDVKDGWEDGKEGHGRYRWGDHVRSVDVL